MARSDAKTREEQGGRLGGRYSRWLAPSVTGPMAVVELVVSMALAMALGWLAFPQNPLLLGLGFPWAWLLPVVLALRYGTLIGAGSALMLLGGWFFFQAVGVMQGELPRMFFLGGVLLVLLAGQFGDIWGARLARVLAASRYLEERLVVLTKSHYLLRISHSRLENDLLARPTTLRDTLLQMRAVANEEAVAGAGPLAGARSVLQVVAQACQLEAAALYACDDKGEIAQAVAHIGPEFELDPDDTLVRCCLETRQVAHLQADALQHDAQTRYVVVAPVLAGSHKLIGVLVVERMPFLSLNYENLQFLMVLLGYYADGVDHAGATHAIQAALPECPYPFALDYARLSRLRRESGIESSVVALVFDLEEGRHALYEQVARSRRALDTGWLVANPHDRAVLTLMPLTDANGVSAYLLRIEDMLNAQFGTGFAASKIGVHTLAVPATDCGNALVQFLRHARIDAGKGVRERTQPPETVGDAP